MKQTDISVRPHYEDEFIYVEVTTTEQKDKENKTSNVWNGKTS